MMPHRDPEFRRRRGPLPDILVQEVFPMRTQPAEFLMHGYGIVEYLNRISKDEQFDVAWFSHVFKHKMAKLTRVKTISLRPLVSGTRNEKKVSEYLFLETETRPPILIDQGVILDGAHRWLAAMQKGEEEIETYVIQDIVKMPVTET